MRWLALAAACSVLCLLSAIRGVGAPAALAEEANQPPQFPATETGARRVPENTLTGQPIGAPVAATDVENDSLSYALGGTDASSFDIDASSAQLLVGASLDYEQRKSYAATLSFGASGVRRLATHPVERRTIPWPCQARSQAA